MPHHHLHLSSAWSYHTHKIIEMQNKVPRYFTRQLFV